MVFGLDATGNKDSEKTKEEKRKAKAAHATTKSFHEKPDLNYCLFES